MTITVQRAAQIFDKNPAITKWVPAQNYKNLVIKYEKGVDGIINKVVTRKDGSEIVGQFKDGKVTKATVESLKGTLEKEFNRPKKEDLLPKYQFEKSTLIKTPDGDTFSRLEDKTNGVMDIWCPKGAPVRSGKFDALYREYLSKVKIN
ncbi:MAG: hypothetical protein NC191_05220 [Muribaculaceae bacterium]|nr:hypothetical protein [Muribaculaceae bacterium]